LLKHKKKIRIFEAGCGHGRLMIDLILKYGNKIEISGMNLIPLHGTKKEMIDNAVKEGLLQKQGTKKIKFPTIIYGDAGEKLPFKTDSIDLVLSQTASYLFKNKLHFFEEVSRILNKKGIGRITLPENPNLPNEFQSLLKIFKDGKQINFENFIKKHDKIKLVKTPNYKAIEITGGKIDFDSCLEAGINLNHLNKKWFGIQSVYYAK